MTVFCVGGQFVLTLFAPTLAQGICHVQMLVAHSCLLDGERSPTILLGNYRPPCLKSDPAGSVGVLATSRCSSPSVLSLIDSACR